MTKHRTPWPLSSICRGKEVVNQVAFQDSTLMATFALTRSPSNLSHPCVCSCTGSLPLSRPQLLSRRPNGCLRFAPEPRRSVLTAAAAVEELPGVAEVEDELESSEVEDEESSSDRNLDAATLESLYQSFENLLDQSMQTYDLGERVVGRVASVEEKGAYVDVGAKSPAWLPATEATNFKVEKMNKVVTPGMDREFLVVYRNQVAKRGKHEIVVSLKEVERELCWKRIQQIEEEKATIRAPVTGSNASGLFVLVDGISGFCPGSHIPQSEKEEGVEALIGQTMKFTVLDCDPEGDRLVVSARTTYSSGVAAQESYKVGDVVLGTVQSVQLYGAFLDLGGGMSGLLHISQISHDRVNSVGDVLSVGDKIKVMVLTHDNERSRLSLSTRKLEPNPGDMLRDPALVFAKADEMAEQFRQRVAEAEKEFGESAYGVEAPPQ